MNTPLNLPELGQNLNNLTASELKKGIEATIPTVVVSPIAIASALHLTTPVVPSSHPLIPTLKTVFSPKKPDLVGLFGSIELPETIEFADQGRVQIIVRNKGKAIASGPMTVKLYISTDANIDVNDRVLVSQVKNLNLRPGRSSTFNLEYENNTAVVAPGAYHLIAKIDSENLISEGSETNNTINKLVSAPHTDVIIDWNATALNAIQAEGEAGRGIAPTTGTRLLSIFSVAVYDAVNAFQKKYKPYNFQGNAPDKASLEAAAVGAAYRVLSVMIPRQIGAFNEQLRKCLQEIQDIPLAEAKGMLFGMAVADQIMASRSRDGSDNNTPYNNPPGGEYVWKPDAPNFTAVGPNWGQVIPWAIPSVAAFSPDGLDGTPTRNPRLYAQDIEEVRRVGGRFDTNVTTIDRTGDQTELTYFWAYDRADTFRPYGQLNQISEEIAVREGNSMQDNARLFASVNVALADAAIVAWNAKYTYNQPRPDDVIAGGIAENDGLAATVGDPNWRPLLDTPPFPDYISGHSTFGGAWAAVMGKFFGENYQFNAVSQELPGVIRTYDSFTAAGFEDALSRIYGGIHVREATMVDAVPTGLAIGNFVAQNLFLEI